MSTPAEKQAAAERVLRAHAAGRTPSLADHIVLGTLEDLEKAQEESTAEDPFAMDEAMESEPDADVEDGDIIDAAQEPRTTRPQPAPEPPAPDPVVVAPADPLNAGAPLNPTEQVLATRAALMNPGMSQDKIRAVARRAMAYLR